jgi:hypothetical protein
MFVSCHQYSAQSGWDAIPNDDLDSENTLVMVFGPSDYSLVEPGLIKLKKEFKLSKLIGCSTSGEIYGKSVNDNSLVVAVIKLEKSRILVTSHQLKDKEDSRRIGERIALDLNSTDLKGVLVLSDGLHVNGSELVKGM